MVNTIINISDLTKDYGNGRGVFDVSIEVKKGECYGFLGPNGAGKTTAIRHLMGFSKPQRGSVCISGRDCWKNAARLKKQIGYVPGEIALPAGLTGAGFLDMMSKMHGIEDQSMRRRLTERFQLDVSAGTRRMSLGEKRKLAIAAAFLHDPAILILDEPTSGLDPVMQQEFIELIREEKARGKTIFLSSHIFHEVDAICDRIAIIRKGRIVSEFRAEELKQNHDSIYSVRFEDIGSYREFTAKGYKITADSEERLKVKVSVPAQELNRFAGDMKNLHVQSFHQIKYSLEDYFMDFYKDERAREEVR